MVTFRALMLSLTTWLMARYFAITPMTVTELRAVLEVRERALNAVRAELVKTRTECDRQKVRATQSEDDRRLASAACTRYRNALVIVSSAKTHNAAIRAARAGLGPAPRDVS